MSPWAWVLVAFFVVDLVGLFVLLVLTRLAQKTHDVESRRMWREAFLVLFGSLALIYLGLWCLLA